MGLVLGLLRSRYQNLHPPIHLLVDGSTPGLQYHQSIDRPPSWSKRSIRRRRDDREHAHPDLATRVAMITGRIEAATHDSQEGAQRAPRSPLV